MHVAHQRPLALALVFFLVGLCGPLAAESTSHAAHHAHHHASVHATALCTWFCAAGQMAEGGHISPAVVGRCAVIGERMYPDAVPADPTFYSFSRGPPLLTTQH
jgi:hypothetical protein